MEYDVKQISFIDSRTKCYKWSHSQSHNILFLGKWLQTISSHSLSKQYIKCNTHIHSRKWINKMKCVHKIACLSPSLARYNSPQDTGYHRMMNQQIKPFYIPCTQYIHHVFLFFASGNKPIEASLINGFELSVGRCWELNNNKTLKQQHYVHSLPIHM